MTELFSTAEAAEYCGLSVSGIKYHVYTVGDLKPTKYFGRSPAFSQESLEYFLTIKRPQGRPRKEEDHGT